MLKQEGKKWIFTNRKYFSDFFHQDIKNYIDDVLKLRAL